MVRFEQATPNNGSKRLLRPAVVRQKMTNGYRVMLAAIADADIRTVVDTARFNGASPFGTIPGPLPPDP